LEKIKRRRVSTGGQPPNQICEELVETAKPIEGNDVIKDGDVSKGDDSSQAQVTAPDTGYQGGDNHTAEPGIDA
jgi:hypothetical protein